jgi:hypothetical protein
MLVSYAARNVTLLATLDLIVAEDVNLPVAEYFGWAISK